jgi:sterol desaturase/sphingolipid hydroxylase (fatty acid hydroxylase superfamily)
MSSEALLSSFILAHEPAVRLAAFFAIFVAMALWEILAPRRDVKVGRFLRWPSNLGIVALDTAVVRIIFPVAAVGAATFAEGKGWGLLNALPIPGLLAVLIAVLALDLAIYAQHVAFHHVPVLWRLHRMHHADLEFDVTTGVRFHPVEVVLSMLIKIVMVIALGASAISVVVFEVLLNATSMFNHGNVRLPRGLDRILRWLLVTPEMHRVHHSIIRSETDSNFGFNFPWWDRLFSTYRAEPALGHERMTIGIDRFRAVEELRLDWMLLQPFRIDGPSGA